MDVPYDQIAAKAAELLTLYVVPTLIAGGKGVAQKVGEKIQDKTAEWVWQKLQPKVDENKKVGKTLEMLVDDAEDEDVRDLFKKRIVELLKDNPDLAKELGQRISVGNGSIGIGGNVENANIFNQSNHNRVVHATNYYESSPQAASESSLLSEEQLTHAYLESLKTECEKLPLGVVNTSFQKDAMAGNIVLQDVYIDLHISPPTKERGGKAPMQEQEETRVLVLKTLADLNLRRVVLLGDAGSGKTTLIHFLTLALAVRHQNPPNTPLQTAQRQSDPSFLQRLLRFSRGNAPEQKTTEEEALEAYFPIRLILRRVDAGKLGVDMLWDALKNDLEQRLGEANARTFFKHLQKRIQAQPCLIMLDGLDEVPEAEDRRLHLLKAIEGFVSLAPHSKFLVTARPYAYDKWRLAGFETLNLLGFDGGQVENFISRFYDAVQKVKSLRSAFIERRKRDLFDAIQERPYLHKLAQSPLLMTEIATVDSSGSELPNSRAELYNQIIRLLLNRWQKYKIEDVQAGTKEIELVQLLNNSDAAFNALRELAYKAHEQQGRQVKRKTDSPAEIDADLLRGIFDRHFPTIPFETLRDFLYKRAGMLLDNGNGMYTFPHRSFQEYLAAAYLNYETDEKYQLLQVFHREPNWWREVILLAIAQKKEQTSTIANNIDELVPVDVNEKATPPTEADWKAAALAAQAALEVKLNEVQQERPQRQIRRLQGWLGALLERGELKPRERAEAGNTLAALGDPRQGVINDFLLCLIPSGEFMMGSKEGDGDSDGSEYPQFQHEIRQAFYMTRYPITNAQFDLFVQADGYKTEAYWGEAKTAGYWNADGFKGYFDNERRTTTVSSHVPYNLKNYPVVGVSWYEAVAYCKWLTEKMQNEEVRMRIYHPKSNQFSQEENLYSSFDILHSVVRLPTEAEWEYAACGRTGGQPYPWVGGITANHANYSDTGIGATSAVGLFPAGENAFGLLDMSGNVWEWCLTKWKDNYKDYVTYEADLNSLAGDNRRVVRGGAYFNVSSLLRCAIRNNWIPNPRNDDVGFRVVVVSSSDISF